MIWCYHRLIPSSSFKIVQEELPFMDFLGDGISQVRRNIGDKLSANKNWQSRKF